MDRQKNPLKLLLLLYFVSAALPLVFLVVALHCFNSPGDEKVRLFSFVFLFVACCLCFIQVLFVRYANYKDLYEKYLLIFSFFYGTFISIFCIVIYIFHFKSFVFLFATGINFVYHFYFDRTKNTLFTKAFSRSLISYIFFHILFWGQSLYIALWLYCFFGLEEESLPVLILGSVIAMGLDQLEAFINRRWPSKKNKTDQQASLTNARYAIYFIPEPGTKLAAFGSELLGRDSESGQPVHHSTLMNLSSECLKACTVNAKRYGLHATLKAPFFLKPDFSERDLLERAADFVVGRRPIILPRLELVSISSFLAIVPSSQTTQEQEAVKNLNTLAAEALSFFDPLRAAPSKQELARRNPQKLSARQRELLAEWGYPYVLDEYRFHITLTDKLETETLLRFTEPPLRFGLAEAGVFHEQIVVSSICVCRQAAPSANDPFMLLKRFYFPRG